jgi:predicted nucleic acid-binding protein
MIRIGIDTSLIVGLLDKKDIWHEKAAKLYNFLKQKKAKIIVFDCVLTEAISTVCRRIHEKRIDDDLSNLIDKFSENFPTKVITWLNYDIPVLYDEIIELIRSSHGELNFNDSLIAISCRIRKISFLASFDKDFDTIDWLKRISKPGDFAPDIHQGTRELKNGE